MTATEKAPSPPLFHFDPATVQNPYPMLARLRAADPIHQFAPGKFVLTRYADVVLVLKDPRFGRAGAAEMVHRAQGLGENEHSYLLPMMFADPPEHTRLRGVVHRAFSPRIVDALIPRIERATTELVDQLAGRDTFELHETIAWKLPVYTICYLFGLPPSDHDGIHELGAAHAASLSASGINDENRPIFEKAKRLRATYAEYFRKVCDERRVAPAEDLISALVSKHDHNELSDYELIASIMGLLFAGHQTTADSIGTGINALLTHRDQWERLVRDPGLLDTAVEEILRWEPAIQAYRRVALEDADVAGVPIPKGSVVMPMSGAANRDPAQFEDPEQFDIGRNPNKHISFGSGIHFCMGGALARAQIKSVLSKLRERCPNLAFASPTPAKFRHGFRGLERLDLALRD